jgi:heme oxygenase
MISERLRTETAHHHEAIENAKRFRRLGQPDFNLEEYKQMLALFYGFYQPLEESFRRFPQVLNALDYEARFKLPLLARDLKALGYTDDMLAQIPHCEYVPEVNSDAQALGAIYVMEGSTHGAQFIAKRLREQLSLGDEGLSYYQGYGSETQARWKAFKLYLDSVLEDGAQNDQVVATASKTFEALHLWMDQ